MKHALVELQKFEQKIGDLDSQIEPNVKMISQHHEKIAQCDDQIKELRTNQSQVKSELQKVEHLIYDIDKDVGVLQDDHQRLKKKLQDADVKN